MKIKRISKGKTAPTMDIECPRNHAYILSNGCVSHNSSATVRDLTESISPIHNYMYRLKGATDSMVIVPEFQRLNKHYTLAFESPELNEHLIELNAIRQLFIDQSQSFDMYVHEDNYDHLYMLKMRIKAWRMGVKTHYYLNTEKNNVDNDSCESCQS